MAQGGPLQTVLTYVGGIMSFFYIILGGLFVSGKISLGLDSTKLSLVGGGLVLYGLTRAFVFYQRIKQMREEE
jgi:hypothetical protein